MRCSHCGGVSTAAPASGASGLGALVEAEARLDDKLANAKVEAEKVRAEARRRAAAADAAYAEDLARERARVSAELEAKAAAERAASEADAQAQIARFDAVRAERLGELARVLAGKVAAVAREGSS